MPHTVVFTDLDSAVWLPDDQAVLSGKTSPVRLAGGEDWSITRRTLRGGLSDGVEVVDLSQGPLSVAVLPTRGMGVWYADCDGLRAGWTSPVGRPVHPRHVELVSRNGLGWLDGFNELLCRCGLSFNGPPGIDLDARSPIESQVSLHGRIANLPAHRVAVAIDESGPGTIAVTGVVDEATMFGPQLRLRSTVSSQIGSRSFTIVDEITNRSAAPTELQLLYHTNVGAPILDEGARFVSAFREMAPRDPRAAESVNGFDEFLGPTPGYAEQVYYFDLLADAAGSACVLLRNQAGDAGISLRFPRERLPCFSLWKCTQAEQDGYVTGLEPATNFPNFKSDERRLGRVINLDAGATYRTELKLEFHTSAAEVAAVEAGIAALQQSQKPTIRHTPAAPFSPPSD